MRHNEAKVYLGKKDFLTAREILLELVNHENAKDLTPYYIDLMTVSVSTKDFDAAEEYLNNLNKLKQKSSHNIYFVEADITRVKSNTVKHLRC